MTARSAVAPSPDTTDSTDLSASARYPPDSCAICLEPISERAITTPCNHAHFDYLCLLTWLLDHDAKCPLCKAQVTSVSYDFFSPTDFKTFRIPKKAADSERTTRGGPGSRVDQSLRLRGQHHRRRRPSPPPSESDLALERRKLIYRYQLYSLHVGANRISQYRNFTPRDFSSSPDLQSRARKWLRRELSVFDFLKPDHGHSAQVARQVTNAEFLLEYVIAILKTVDIKGSNGRAEDLLQEFLGRENARLLLHELETWLRSPYNDIRDWDRAVQYPEVKEEPGQSDGLDRRKRQASNMEAASTQNQQRGMRDRYRPYYSR